MGGLVFDVCGGGGGLCASVSWRSGLRRSQELLVRTVAYGHLQTFQLTAWTLALHKDIIEYRSESNNRLSEDTVIEVVPEQFPIPKDYLTI